MTGGASLLADGHVHFHPCFTWAAFLHAAAANLGRARRELRLAPGSPGCLLFTESAGACAYRALLDGPPALRERGWRVAPTDEACSIVLRHAAHDPIIVVSGRQIVTAERLEVLALGCTGELPAGAPIRDVIPAVAGLGAIAVVPWGLGKWLGRRGRIVRALLDEAPVRRIALGDNGGRPARWPRPVLLTRAERLGVPVLPGSDPLPLPEQVVRAGSYGFVLDDWRQTSRPFLAIRERIRTLPHSPRTFGARSSILAAMRAQLAIRRYPNPNCCETRG